MPLKSLERKVLKIVFWEFYSEMDPQWRRLETSNVNLKAQSKIKGCEWSMSQMGGWRGMYWKQRQEAPGGGTLAQGSSPVLGTLNKYLFTNSSALPVSSRSSFQTMDWLPIKLIYCHKYIGLSMVKLYIPLKISILALGLQTLLPSELGSPCQLIWDWSPDPLSGPVILKNR